jgi:transcriptional regulator with XRE-family HTH domain
MGDAGQKLKRARERIGLTYREVEEASQRIARVRGSDEFALALSRLADIENKDVVPSLFKLYSLSAIYHIEITEIMGWYGANVANLPADAAIVNHGSTHHVGFLYDDGEGQVPLAIDPVLNLDKTQFLSRFIQRWGKIPLMLLNHMDLRQSTYGFVGTKDWSMYPILYPGSLVVIDQSRRRVVSGGWTSEHDRPIYFLEHRDGYLCGWCSLTGKRLTVTFHPSSAREPMVFVSPEEVDVIGQVTDVAMTIDPATLQRPRD